MEVNDFSTNIQFEWWLIPIDILTIAFVMIFLVTITFDKTYRIMLKMLVANSYLFGIFILNIY